MANPFEVQPVNVLQALMMGTQGYNQGRKIAQDTQRQSALQQLMGGGDGVAGTPNFGGVATTLAQSGDLEGAAQVANVAKALAGPEQTELLKNVAAENKLRAAKGLPALSPLDYDLQREKAKASVTTVNANVNAAVNPVLKGVSDRFNETVDAADASRKQISAIHDARKALDDGAITGQWADKRLVAEKIGGLFGVPQDRVANTEVLRSAVGQGMLAQAKTLGTNPSNADREIIQRITGGDIELDEKALRRILDIQERWARDSIKNANTRAGRFLQAYPKELAPVRGLLNTEEPPVYGYTPNRSQPNPRVDGLLNKYAPKQ